METIKDPYQTPALQPGAKVELDRRTTAPPDRRAHAVHWRLSPPAEKVTVQVIATVFAQTVQSCGTAQ